MSSEMLSKAIRIAAEAHENQIDKSGKCYILHPIRVMQSVGPNFDLMAAAVLHDVPEDTRVTLDDLRHLGFKECVVSAVDSVTRRIYPIPGVIFDRHNPATYTKEEYPAFIQRAKENRFGCIIKIRDIEDNVSSKRLEQLPNDVMIRMLKKYAEAKQELWLAYVDACYKIYGMVL